MKRILILSFSFVILAACTSNKKENNSSGDNDSLAVMENDSTPAVTEKQTDEHTVSPPSDEKEAHYSSSKNAGYKKALNERFGFSFDLPEVWKAIDKSNNGDGYFMITDDPSADIRIFGEDISGNPAILELTACKGEKFTYSDGTKGTKCVENGEVTYNYTTKKTHVTFYIKASPSWMEKNADFLSAIAKSIHIAGKPA